MKQQYTFERYGTQPASRKTVAEIIRAARSEGIVVKKDSGGVYRFEGLQLMFTPVPDKRNIDIAIDEVIEGRLSIQEAEKKYKVNWIRYDLSRMHYFECDECGKWEKATDDEIDMYLPATCRECEQSTMLRNEQHGTGSEAIQ